MLMEVIKETGSSIFQKNKFESDTETKKDTNLGPVKILYKNIINKTNENDKGKRKVPANSNEIKREKIHQPVLHPEYMLVVR